MRERKYQRPTFLLDSVKSDKDYKRWLDRKVAAHLKRDRRRGNKNCTGDEYRNAIHKAVEQSNGIDAYTGEQLDWGLISKWDNIEARKGGKEYKRRFALLPSIDHVGDGLGKADFRICAWRTNDAKSDLSDKEFCDLCKLVIEKFCNKSP